MQKITIKYIILIVFLLFFTTIYCLRPSIIIDNKSSQNLYFREMLFFHMEIDPTLEEMLNFLKRPTLIKPYDIGKFKVSLNHFLTNKKFWEIGWNIDNMGGGKIFKISIFSGYCNAKIIVHEASQKFEIIYGNNIFCLKRIKAIDSK